MNRGARVDKRALTRVDASQQLCRVALLAELHHVAEVRKDATVGKAEPRTLQSERGGAVTVRDVAAAARYDDVVPVDGDDERVLVE